MLIGPPSAGFFVLMKNFKPSEFRRRPAKDEPFVDWYPLINLDLLQKLQDFRDCWGQPIYISPADGAVGRQDNSKSYHNFNKWGEVRALDVMFDMYHAVSAIEADRLARHCGITGIGFYPHWQRFSNSKGKMVPAPGFHIDNRPDLTRWGAYKDEKGIQVYCKFEKALVKMGDE